jgi:hypothetical protein
MVTQSSVQSPITITDYQLLVTTRMEASKRYINRVKNTPGLVATVDLLTLLNTELPSDIGENNG